MKTRIIFAAVAVVILAAGLWLALGDAIASTPPAPAPAATEIISGIPAAPDADPVSSARPVAHASVRVTVPAATDPPPVVNNQFATKAVDDSKTPIHSQQTSRVVPRDAEFVRLDRPIIGTINGRQTIIEPGYYRIFKQNNRLEEF